MHNHTTHQSGYLPHALVVIWLVLWLSACAPGAPPVAPAPIATAPSPAAISTETSAVPLTPIGTSITPTLTRVATALAVETPTASSQDAGTSLSDVVERTAGLEVLRVESQVVMEPSGDSSTITNTLTGSLRNRDAHLIIGGDTSEVQFILRNGQLYQRDESNNPNWIQLSEQEAQSTQPKEILFAPLQSLVGEAATWQARGTETVDGADCALYVRDRYAAADQFLRAIMRQSDVTNEYIDAQMESAHAAAWVCPDGYLRQIEMDIAYRPSVRPFRMRITWRVLDINGDFTIPTPALNPDMPQGDATQAVQEAVKKTRTLDSYRFETTGVSDEKEVLVAKGVTQGGNSLYTLVEPVSGQLTESEVLVHDGQMYRRPLGTQDPWQASNDILITDYGKATLSNFDQLAPDPSADGGPNFIGSNVPFAWKAKENLDGMACDVYAQTQPVQIGAYYEMTVCPDGYWHRGEFTISMEAGDMSGILSMTMTTRLTDLNAPITIDAP